MKETKQKLPKLVVDDPWLEPHVQEIENRIDRFVKLKSALEQHYGSIYDFAGAHKFLGFNYDKERRGWYYREWAPNAHALFLIGDFNGWNRNSHPLHQIEGGVWEIFLDDDTYAHSLKHNSKIKVLVHAANGAVERIPAMMTRVGQDPGSPNFSGLFWNPETAFSWEGDSFDPTKITEPIIYECHIGMATESGGVGTFKEFEDNVLPRIKDLGYNTIQMMAVQEHPYYASFGYHVSSFFAVSSRFGTPEELKSLIKKAHSMGIAVVMDIVHSHAVKNLNEGLNEYDGTDYQYFHAGGKGDHPDWDSKIFNYGKWEVIQFLLSNVRYWLEEFRFDGFRFDGVTSMLYHHHGHAGFASYDDYFGMQVDTEAITYLQLANELAHEVRKGVMTIAEDVSGMPGLGRPVLEGGLGFDFRLGMGIPDFWIKILEEQRDEDWNVWDFWSVMVNRRWNEKTIAYAESHDQALVGDKTIAFWLMDKEMYEGMDNASGNIVVDRGIALHKMIRFLTLSLGGEGYLTFMGNEFGHPEWVDFPREGNNWSYHYARRQWSLADNGFLRYQKLNNFEKAMIDLAKKYHVLAPQEAKILNMDANNHTIIFQKGELVYVFNFDPSNSIPDYEFNIQDGGSYELILDSDAPEFGGFGRVSHGSRFFTDEKQHLKIYNVNRTVQVFRKVD
ncbi:alpha-amylase family glycosyl hydrolase [Limibacter armeniacum]|uniref:alpha-amylase family glycosyl hydrolase n=1 Tax=Limibacter armeniacum TaxID=466084 RepID=UPI002FE600F2